METLPIDATGLWWVPANQDEKVPGRLTIDARHRAMVESHDVVSRSWFPAELAPSLDASAPVRSPAVYGEVAGRPVTLLDCIIYAPFVDQGTIDIRPRGVAYGAWIASPTDRACREMTVEMEHLAAWSGRTTLRPAFPGPGESHHDSPLTTYTTIDPMIATVGDLTVSLEWSFTHIGTWTPSGRSYTFNDRTMLRVRPEQPVDVQEMGRYARILQDMLTFAAGRAVAFTSIRLVTEQGEPPVATLYTPTIVVPDPDVRPLVGSEMAFTAAEIDFSDFVPRWFACHDRFRTVLGTLLGLHYLPRQFVENKVTNLVAAAEQAYRAIGGEEYCMTRAQHRAVRERIRTALAAESDLASLTDRVVEKVDRRVTLEERLRMLTDRLDAVAAKLLRGQVNIWVQAAKQSRNDLAHAGATDKFNGSELATIAKTTAAVVELTVLAELGLDRDGLIRVVDRRYDDVAPRWNAWTPATEQPRIPQPG